MTCPTCGATNRIRPDAVQDKLARGAVAVCGRCKTPLPVPAPTAVRPVVVTDATFAGEVEQASVPVLVDAWAPWCGPCKMLSPVVDELASELVGRVRVVKLNVDENPATAARFGIRGIPTLLVLRAGREVDRMVGVLPKAEIARRLDRALA
jgi:thioredoxin 2